MASTKLQEISDNSQVKITIMIDRQPRFEMLFQCQKGVKIRSLIEELQKIYDPIVGRKQLFQDQRCDVSVNTSKVVHESNNLYLCLAQDQYEAIIKKVFFAQKEVNKEEQIMYSSLIFNPEAQKSVPPTIQPQSDGYIVMNQVSAFQGSKKNSESPPVPHPKEKSPKEMHVIQQKKDESVQQKSPFFHQFGRFANDPTIQKQNPPIKAPILKPEPLPSQENLDPISNISNPNKPPVQSNSCCSLI